MIQILWGRSSGFPDAGLVLLTLDAAISTKDEYTNKITSYPVENGLDISDHVKQEPDEFDVEGMVSDTPDDYFTLDGPHSATAYKALCMIAGRDYVAHENAYIKNEFPNPIMVDIIGKYRIFTDMMIEKFVAPRTINTGDTIHFTAHFKKIRKAEVSLSVIKYTSAGRVGSDGVDRSQGNADQGKKQPEAVSNPIQDAINSLPPMVRDLIKG